MLKKLFGHRLKGEDIDSYRLFLDNKADIEQLIAYKKLPTNWPVPHFVKQNTIHKYRDQYSFKVFVETGTYLGDMVDAQMNYFDSIYSIELSDTLYEDAVNRFIKFPKVKIILGDSGVVLKDLIREIHQPALFWLDGHYSSGITAKGDKNTPILAELEIILSATLMHGVLIDDARLFNGQEDYPSIDELSSFIIGMDKNRAVSVADDIIRVFQKKPGTLFSAPGMDDS